MLRTSWEVNPLSLAHVKAAKTHQLLPTEQTWVPTPRFVSLEMKLLHVCSTQAMGLHRTRILLEAEVRAKAYRGYKLPLPTVVIPPLNILGSVLLVAQATHHSARSCWLSILVKIL